MKKIFLLIIITLLVFGCKKDFLDRIPNTSTVIENFYNTPDDATEALTAVYNMLLRDDWWASYIFSEIRSDNCAGGAGTGDGGGFQRVDRCLTWPEANAHQEIWETYFGAIYRANVYLENEELIDWTGEEALRIQYQAEAKFLRAHFHFYLARMFGEIPALDHTLTPDEIPSRTPAEELYSFMIDDLVFCAENGLKATYPAMTKNWGHATSWAAKAMIGRIYLYYSGYYNDPDLNGFTAEDARDYIDDVINNSGHDLVDQFASLWRVSTYSELGGDTSIDAYAGETNPEVVWSVRCYITSAGNQQYGGAWFQRMIGPRGTNIDPYGQGWGAIPVLPSLWNTYDITDTRRTATILSWDDEGITYDWVGQQQAQYTGYSCKKYEHASVGNVVEIISLGGTDWQWDGLEDFMIIRFADVLLMGAELYVITNGGSDGTALNYFNRVRERAFGDNTHNYSASLTVDDILDERRLELACEGLRYWDILRSCNGDFSKLVDILTYIDDNDGGDFSNSADTESLDVDGNNFVDKKGLFQIPQNELDLMDGIIDQNPGFKGENE